MFNVCPSASNIDRSVKDLQRCTASLTRYRMVVKEEMDSSIKRMKQTFAELQSWCVHFFSNLPLVVTGVESHGGEISEHVEK